MTGKYLVDTNILIYAYDRSEPVKQAKALEVLDTLAGNGGYLSPQILAEFFSVATKKIAAPLSIEQGYASLGNYIQFWDIVDLTSAIVLEAARGVKDHQTFLLGLAHLGDGKAEPNPHRYE